MDNAEQHHHRTITDLLTARTLRAGHRPLVTCYDDVTGARTELSYATLDNWAAKTANLIVEEFDVGPGDTVGLDLDGHWTAAAILLACWRIGAGASPGAGAGGAAVMCCHERRLREGSEPAGGHLLVVGDGLAAEPTTPVKQREGLLVLADEVHAFADDYDDSEVTPHSSALVLPDATLDHHTLLALGARLHSRIGDRQRIALAGALDDPVAAVVLVATLLGAGSLVATRRVRAKLEGGDLSDGTADAWPGMWDRLVAEHATVLVGPSAALMAAGPPPASITTIGV